MGTISNLVTADHREGEADSAETELFFHCYKYLDCDSCDVSLHEKSVAVSAWCLLLARPHRMLLCLLLQPSQPSPDLILLCTEMGRNTGTSDTESHCRLNS